MRHRKPLPAILVVLLDLLGIGAALGIYALFLFYLPSDGGQPLQSIVFGDTPAPVSATAAPEPTPGPSATAESVIPTPDPTPTPAPGDFSATFPTGELNAENAVGTYADENLRIVITEHHTEETVYFVADVWIRNIQEYRTAFSGSKFKGGYSMPSSMASKVNAILAISGDSCGSTSSGIVIRNGNLYRDTTGGDVCVLYADGVMESYYESDFNLDEAVARGAYQAWSFGPKLIDNGQIPQSYNSTSVIIGDHSPRAALGYYEPGHYCLVTVDGRQGDYSRGMTLDELAQAMIDLGCVDAYNLDGGQSVMMVFQGQVVGQPYKGGREISDIVYFGGDAPQ